MGIRLSIHDLKTKIAIIFQLEINWKQTVDIIGSTWHSEEWYMVETM